MSETEILKEKEELKLRLLKNKKTKFLNNLNFMDLVFISFIAFLMINIANTLIVKNRLTNQSKKLSVQYDNVKKERKYLNEEIEFYKSEKGIEKMARERLGFIKNDEIPVRFFHIKKKEK